MSNIINTYLKIEKCSFEDYNQSSKEFNTIYFITDTLQIFIGDKEYMKTETVKQFQDLLENSLLPEFQNKVYEYIEDQLKNITIDKAENDFIYAGSFYGISELITHNFEKRKIYRLTFIQNLGEELETNDYFAEFGFDIAFDNDVLLLVPLKPNGKIFFVNLSTGACIVSYIADQTYTPESENAQSGKAVAEAISTKVDNNGWNIPRGDSEIGDGDIHSTSFSQDQILWIDWRAVHSSEPDDLKRDMTVKSVGVTTLRGLLLQLYDEGDYFTVNDRGIKHVEDALQEIGAKLADFDTALDELHTYAQGLIEGGATE